MKNFSWQSRVLPLTMTAIAILFAEKAVVLAKDAASGSRPVIAQAAPAGDAVADRAMSPAVAPAGSTVKSAGEVTAPAVNPVQPAELKLLQDLRNRRAELDQREHRLDEQAQVLEAAQAKLQGKLEELTALQTKLQVADGDRRKRASANWSGLVKTYEDMKPADAAGIFNVLDMSVLLEVLDRMDERKAAAVLAGMSPERARMATQMLAQKRIRQDDNVPGRSPLLHIVINQARRGIARHVN